MTEAEWLSCDDTNTLVEFLRVSGSSRKLRLFACACAYHVWYRVTDKRCQEAVITAERYADAGVSDGELAAACRAAYLPGGRDGSSVANGASQSDSGYAAYLAVFYTSYHLNPKYKSYFGASHPSPIRGDPYFPGRLMLAPFLRDIFGNPFHPVTFDPAWRTDTAVNLARQMYESRDFSAMPILADALQDAGCDSAEILDHCRGPGPHVRGCWVVDLVLGKE
jgi:hypothetical protein